MDAQLLTKRIIDGAKKNSPVILAGAAMGGVVITAILAVRATPKALDSMAAEISNKAAAEERAVTLNDKLTKTEAVKVAWKHYIPAGLAGAATIAYIAWSNQIGARRNAALVAAYTLVDSTFREYKDKVLEEFGAKSEEGIREKVAQAQIDKSDPPAREIILATGSDQLCFEQFTGRYFRGNIEEIRRAENEINHRIGLDMYASLNEFYDEIGLEHTDAGTELGWNVENRVKIAFTSHLNPDGIPCLAFSYLNNPRADFGKCF